MMSFFFVFTYIIMLYGKKNVYLQIENGEKYMNNKKKHIKYTAIKFGLHHLYQLS